MATISGISGHQFVQGTQAYQNNKYQYASSTHEIDHDMNPGLIILPKNKDDIVVALQYAKSKKLAVAIRTGGHQYSGASSTSAPNIQLDLKATFKGSDDRAIFDKEGTTFVRTSVSWNLGEFNAYLTSHKLFVPHGQCTDVCLGGHVQTGGWGQLIRSFGLFGDHVISLEMLDHDGNFKEVTKTTSPELFYAILGGSPGNFGVLTHFTIQVHRDSDYIGSRGQKSLFWYDTNTLKRLLDIVVGMSQDDNFPRNYDLCVSVLSSSFQLLDLMPEIDGQMRREHPEIYGINDMPSWPRTIVVYAQWVPFDKKDVPDMGWFSKISQGSIFNLGVKQKPMSAMTGDWLFRRVREYDHAYVKRAYLTQSPTLDKDGWTTWVTKRINDIVEPEANRCWLSGQVQYLGGRNSQFAANAGNGTSYSWRDSTLLLVLDCFYSTAEKDRAEDWQNTNDKEGLGPTGIFSKQDRRVLWGSYGSYDLDESWSYYYEDRAKYERLQKARQAADPDGIFTPNTFSVKRLP